MATTEERALSHDDLTHLIQHVAIERGDYGGYPMPIEGHSLQLADGFPYPGVGEHVPDGSEPSFACSASDVDETESIRNEWYSRRLRARVWIFEEQGRVQSLVDPVPDWMYRLRMQLHTLHAGLAWHSDADIIAQEKLAELIGLDRYARFVASGAFVETSRRSGVTYIFRRLRPTIALRDNRFLAALCMHPIGYYTDTFAGSMCPTDDMIAHLLLMRGDEHMLWRRCNQHPAWVPQAGL